MELVLDYEIIKSTQKIQQQYENLKLSII